MTPNLIQAIKDTKEYLQRNRNGDISDNEALDFINDALDFLFDECGLKSSGGCSREGSKYCIFECPFAERIGKNDEKI